MSLKDSALYQLCPLTSTSRSIRVLELAAPSATDNSNAETEHLSGILHVVDLSENPRYTALSYVWGPPGPHIITCNGIQLPITTNCHDALKALRRRYGKLTVWVDAISINQQDGHEKNGQVTLMGEIFSWAETVYVWLGNGNQASDAAMDCLKLIPSNLQCLQPARCSATLDKYARARETLRFIGRELWFAVDLQRLSIRQYTHRFLGAWQC
jgi:Heterokaryon incompatibility protein (HET)